MFISVIDLYISKERFECCLFGIGEEEGRALFYIGHTEDGWTMDLFFKRFYLDF
jgi:hypothetical protein